jgi:hypothetical protein
MAYLTFNDLSETYRSIEYFSKAQNLNESLSGASTSYEKRIFLSYRRKDKKYVTPVVDFLKKRGVKVYIDYLDESLPDKPSSETAGILRHRINSSDKLILFATPNSSVSKWIPWELGLGDGFLKYENIAILPVTNTSSYWEEQEYFEIYGHIKKGSNNDIGRTDWAIFFPNGHAFWLDDWMRK